MKKGFRILKFKKDNPIFEVKDISKSFDGRPILKKLSLKVFPGECVGILGPNGCGKTTTARCILRAMKPTEGKIKFKTTDGSHTDLATLKEDQIRSLRTDIQMIFQDPFASLNPRMNILDLIGEPMLVNGLTNRKQRTEKVVKLIFSN